jgi:hypothetical protein
MGVQTTRALQGKSDSAKSVLRLRVHIREALRSGTALSTRQKVPLHFALHAHVK